MSPSSLSFINTSREILAESGVKGMYRGLLPTVVREGIGSVAFFAAYEVTKKQLSHAAGIKPKEANGNIILLSGGLAGLAYVLVAHPFETAAVLIQLDCYQRPKYFGMVDVIQQVTKRAGFFGLYRGVGPSLARAFPSYAAAFYGYEWTLRTLDPRISTKAKWDDHSR